ASRAAGAPRIAGPFFAPGGMVRPHPGPPPLAGEGVSREWRRLGRPALSPACGGRPGWGRCRTRGFAAQRSDLAPTPTLPRGRGRGGGGGGGAAGGGARSPPPAGGAGGGGGG